MIVSPAKKTANPIDMPLGLWIQISPTNYVLDGCPDPQTRRGNFEREKELPIAKHKDSLP